MKKLGKLSWRVSREAHPIRREHASSVAARPSGIRVRTVQEEGWTGLNNGALLREAETTFEVLVTVDKRLQHQQNIAGFRIGIVVISAQSTRLVHMRPLVPQLKQAIEQARPGTVVAVAAV